MIKGGIFCCFLLIFVAYNNYGTTKVPLKESINESTKGKHPVHISFATIEYFEKEKKFRILFKLFVDDFDVVLKEKYGKDLKLLEGRWEKRYVKTINTYLSEHFKLVSDGKNRAKNGLKLIKHEVKEQAMWLYYNLSYKPKSSVFKLQNTILTDLYSDQKNLLIFVFKDEQKALQFNIKQTLQEISFK